MTDDYSRRQFLGGTALVCTAALAGCTGSSGDQPDGGNGDGGDSDGGDGGGAPDAVTVEMTDSMTFEPKRVEVAEGGTVTWKNVGAVGHTVTAYEDELPDGADYFASGDFDSEQAAVDGYPGTGTIDGDGTYEHTFETAGTYEYYCIPHEGAGMVGTVEVV